MSVIVELDFPNPSATDGEIAAINLESPRETPSTVTKMTKGIVAFCRALGLAGHAGQKGYHKQGS